MTDIISLTIIYIFGCYILYLIGVLISRLWLIFIIPILIFLIACLYTKIWNNLNIHNFFGDVIPIMCLVIPSITKTLQGIILPLNPIKCFFIAKDWFLAQNYKENIKRERQQQEEAERKKQENLNEQFRRAQAQEKQRQREKQKKVEQEARRTQEQTEKPHGSPVSEHLREAYAILGVNSSMSMADIKKAYYAQYKKCDPSRINDMNEELVKHANKMAQKLNWAIDVVKIERGEG